MGFTIDFLFELGRLLLLNITIVDRVDYCNFRSGALDWETGRLAIE